MITTLASFSAFIISLQQPLQQVLAGPQPTSTLTAKRRSSRAKEYNTDVNERRIVNERRMNISIIIPARDAEMMMPLCLQAIRDSSIMPHEVIVVDDHSTDLTAEIGRKCGARVVQNESRPGPAAARNLGA